MQAPPLGGAFSNTPPVGRIMQGKAVLTALSKYVTSLVLTILAPLQWARILKVAGNHHGLDPKARGKIVVGIVAGLALAGFSTYLVLDFEDDATQGIYESLSGRLSLSLGNEAYRAAVADQEAALNLIATADRKIAEAQEAGNAEDEATWEANREGFVDSYNEATERVERYTPNHMLFQEVRDVLLEERDDAAAKQLIANRGDVTFEGLDARTDSAFDKKDEAVADMQTTLLWFVYPGLIGVLWAPVAYATGNVLKTTFVPSDSVGFKPYPAKASALFLLFGAFGVPALFFAAWVMQDFVDRTAEGQISL